MCFFSMTVCWQPNTPFPIFDDAEEDIRRIPLPPSSEPKEQKVMEVAPQTPSIPKTLERTPEPIPRSESCAPVIDKSWLSYLYEIINEFCNRLKEVPNFKFIPKLHYLVHYPRLIQKYGPLIRLWCMRFEAKHQYFKKIANSSRNFRNISWTLAKRHQMLQCYERCGEKGFESDNFEKYNKLKYSSLPSSLKLFVMEYFSLFDPKVTNFASVLTVKSVTYKSNYIFPIRLTEEDIPVFMKIHYIIQMSDKWHLLGRLLKCKAFDKHFYCYNVEEVKSWYALAPGSEIDSTALLSHKQQSEIVIILNHKLSGFKY